MSSHSRRTFLKRAGVLSIGFAGLSRFVRAETLLQPAFGYGPLIPDPKGIFDLPQGFAYRILSRVGDEMDDGLLLPGQPDGMAAFPAPDGRVVLVRNHELSPKAINKSAFGLKNERLDRVNKSHVYDLRDGLLPSLGGTTNLVYNPKTGEVEKQFLSLAGTELNCAGGPTPWGTWVSCEESNMVQNEFYQRNHGFNFEVPATPEPGLVDPVPLKAMGRFRHEAIAVEPVSGVVYQTEDMWDSLIYRFVPDVKGKLAEGGRLQALSIKGSGPVDTRNWGEEGAPEFSQGLDHAVEWVDLDDVEAPKDDLRYRGREKGGAVFARGEGMWYENGELYFACTNGGPLRTGQVFRYLPSPFEGTSRESEAPGRLQLFVESSDKEILQNCDNLTVAPTGDLYLAEDVKDDNCRLIGVTPQGQCFTFGSNPYNTAELAGVCFSPDGSTMFVNIQGSGLTLAITGPWKRA